MRAATEFWIVDIVVDRSADPTLRIARAEKKLASVPIAEYAGLHKADVDLDQNGKQVINGGLRKHYVAFCIKDVAPSQHRNSACHVA